MSRAVVLLSGGLDSTTTLAVARRDGHEPLAITFRYGQRHEIEVDAARRVARAAKVTDPVVVDIDLRTFGARRCPANLRFPRTARAHHLSHGIPVTYVPARNTIFLSYALAFCGSPSSARDLHRRQCRGLLGISRLPARVHRGLSSHGHLATRAGVEGSKVHSPTPVIELTKAQIIRWASRWAWTTRSPRAATTPQFRRCLRHCDSCVLRLKGSLRQGCRIHQIEPRALTSVYTVKEIFTRCRRGIPGGSPLCVLPLQRVQSVDGARTGRAGTRFCKFGDTDFFGVGPRRWQVRDGGQFGGRVAALWPSDNSAGSKPYVVCTGGEPLLQLDPALVSALHAEGFEVAVETNGTQDAPAGIDWICVSPKANAPLRLMSGNELKLVYPQTEPEAQPECFEHLPFRHFSLQPMDGPQLAENTRRALEYCLAHPRWRLSLQTHKLLGLR